MRVLPLDDLTRALLVAFPVAVAAWSLLRTDKVLLRMSSNFYKLSTAIAVALKTMELSKEDLSRLNTLFPPER